jgi:hypothetical protein
MISGFSFYAAFIVLAAVALFALLLVKKLIEKHIDDPKSRRVYFFLLALISFSVCYVLYNERDDSTPGALIVNALIVLGLGIYGVTFLAMAFKKPPA